jgi:hypothetical protein
MMTPRKKKPAPGRPSQGRSEYLEVRLTPEEKERFSTVASSTGLSLSDWVRLSLRASSHMPTIVGSTQPTVISAADLTEHQPGKKR